MTNSWGDSVSYSCQGILTMDGHSMEELAHRFGTPLFVGSRIRLEENVRTFLRAFSGHPEPVLLAYSTKTNNNLGVLEVLNETGIHASVCSGLDYTAARMAGFPPDRIFLDGLVHMILNSPRVLTHDTI